MSTKYQRRMRATAAKRGEQFALERTVLAASRALSGAVRKRGITEVGSTTWSRFLRATDNLQAFHAERQRRIGMNKGE